YGPVYGDWPLRVKGNMLNQVRPSLLWDSVVMRHCLWSMGRRQIYLMSSRPIGCWCRAFFILCTMPFGGIWLNLGRLNNTKQHRMSKIKIVNAKIIMPDRIMDNGILLIHDGVISGIGGEDEKGWSGEVLD